MKTEKIEYDEALWVTMDHCDGKHYILGNPHTFPGRMMLWCPKKKRSFFASKSDFIEISEAAKYWIKGFLVGNEPVPPLDGEGMVDFESQDYIAWKAKVKEFHKTGYWESEVEKNL